MVSLGTQLAYVCKSRHARYRVGGGMNRWPQRKLHAVKRGATSQQYDVQTQPRRLSDNYARTCVHHLPGYSQQVTMLMVDDTSLSVAVSTRYPIST